MFLILGYSLEYVKNVDNYIFILSLPIVIAKIANCRDIFILNSINDPSRAVFDLDFEKN